VLSRHSKVGGEIFEVGGYCLVQRVKQIQPLTKRVQNPAFMTFPGPILPYLWRSIFM